MVPALLSESNKLLSTIIVSKLAKMSIPASDRSFPAEKSKCLTAWRGKSVSACVRSVPRRVNGSTRARARGAGRGGAQHKV